MERLTFLTPEQARRIREQYGTPVFVYDENSLRENAAMATAFPNAYGLVARYAMKANPNASILRIFADVGMHIDASSEFEVQRAILADIPAAHISLSSQEVPSDINALMDKGILYNATSLWQLENYGRTRPGTEVGLRLNPGVGSGGTTKTNVGGPSSSFGLWHEQIDEAKTLCEKYGVKVVRIHTHIGSGSDPNVWQKTSRMSIELVKHFPDVHTLNLGGGYKVGRMSFEQSTDLQTVGTPVKELFERFAEEYGRKLTLEIEPGTFMVGNAGCIVSTIQDIVHTGNDGYRFLRIDGGMTDILRPSLYGAQHPMSVVGAENDSEETDEYIVTGHCCESGDMLTPAPDKPDDLAPRKLAKATIGDLLVIDGTGAYCSAMCAKNYNSFPETPEVLLQADGTFRQVRKRQTLEQIIANEV